MSAIADNKTLPPTGTGTADIIVATDEIAGVDYQKIKLVNGTADSTQVAIVDATGSLQTINAGTQVLGTDVYTEATSKGLTAGAVRRDADTTLVGTTNEFGPLQMDANGRLKVEAFSGETLPTSLAALPALVAGSANIGDVDVLTVPADPFGVNADAASATGSLSAKLRLQAATALVGDAAATATPTGTMQMGLAKATAPTDVSADNDAVAPWHLRNGAQVVNLAAGGTLLTNTGQAAASANFGKLTDGTLTVGAVDETGAAAVDALAVGGGTPHDAVDSGNPVKVGGRASSTIPTAVTSGDRANAWQGLSGHLVVSDVATELGAGADGQNQSRKMMLDGTPTYLPSGASLHGFNGTGWDRLKTSAGVTVAGTPNTDLGILATGVGPGWDRKRDPAGVLATSTANAVTITVDGADAIILHVTAIGTTPGSMIIEQTADDTNWVTAGAVLKLGALDTWVEGSFVPAVNDVYMVRTNGVRQIRYRVNAVYASGTATIKYTSVSGTPIIKSIEMPGAPHKIGYPLVGVSAQYTTTQTSTTLGPTVASTQRLVVTSIQIQAGGTTAGELQVYFGTGAFSRGTSKPIFDGEFAPSATLKPGFAQSPSVPWMGAADEELKVTDSAAINKLTVTCWYYLVTA